MEQKLPNFFIVGAPKAGTTSLFEYLRKHPQVFMPVIKEPNFFSYADTIAQNLYHKEKGIGEWDEYVKLFEPANGALAIGEASVSYLFYPNVPERIHEKFPDARIVIVLRNPIDRAYSHYFMEHKLGYVRVPFDDIVLKKTTHKNALLYYQQYVELGIYAPQVQRYFNIFGKDHVKVFIYDELSYNMLGMIIELFTFLGIDTSHLPDLDEKHNTYSTPRNPLVHLLYSQKGLRNFARKILPPERVSAIKNLFLTQARRHEHNPETIRRLLEIYKPDIMQVEKLLDKNLSNWYE